MKKAKIMIDDNNKVHYVPVVPVRAKAKTAAVVGGLKAVSAFHYLKRGVTNFTNQTVHTVKETPKAVVSVGSSVRDTVVTAKVRRAGRKALYEQVGYATVSVGSEIDSISETTAA